MSASMGGPPITLAATLTLRTIGLTLITSLVHLLLSFGLTTRLATTTFPLLETAAGRGSFWVMLTAHTLVLPQGMQTTPFTWRSTTYRGESTSTF